MNRVLAKFRGSFAQQLTVLEQAETALLVGNLSAELQQIAQQEAHKLAGSMGTFGYPQGSRIAMKIENLLMHNRLWTAADISNFSQLLKALQQELTLVISPEL